MAKRRRLDDGKKSSDVDHVDVATDRISGLPNHVIWIILSFLPTIYAVRMSVLSKRWRHVWCFLPTLEFSDADFGFDMGSLKRTVDMRVMRRVADAAVTSFKLRVRDGRVNTTDLRNWLTAPVVQNYVKELVVCLQPLFNNSCVVLSGRSLVMVKLKRVAWDDSCPVYLPSLRALYLNGVDINGETLSNLVSGCRFLEKCVFKHMSSNNIVRISSSSLKFLEIKGVSHSIEVDAANLLSLALFILRPNVDSSRCRAIRDLALLGPRKNLKSRNAYYEQVSKLPVLENLTLCEVYRDIKISSETLKSFCVIKFHNEEARFTMETPNLVSFCYKGSVGLSMLMETPDHQLNGSLFIQRTSGLISDMKWYDVLKEFISNVKCSWNNVCLHVCDKQGVTIPKSVRARFTPWPDVKHLKVVVYGRKLTRTPALESSLQWISPSLEIQSLNKKFNHDLTKWIAHH